jgi:superoxide reductase
MKIGERIQEADWKHEKHAPVIECPGQVERDEIFEVKVSLGKEISHPNTTEHHIRWISLYFHPQDTKFTYDVCRIEFNAHGESGAGPNKGPVHASPSITTSIKINKPGTLHALAYCNIHGLWESSKEITLS